MGRRHRTGPRLDLDDPPPEARTAKIYSLHPLPELLGNFPETSVDTLK